VELSVDAKISIVSTAITIVSMLLTIWMARGVRKIRDQIATDIRRINLTHASRNLEKTLLDIRKLQDSSSSNSRGRGKATTLDSIQSQFDAALMQLDMEGPDADIRKLISSAQNNLQKIRSESNAADCEPITAELQSIIQDAVSTLNGRSLRLEGKATLTIKY